MVELTHPTQVIADIGTDHAYVPCALIKNKKALKCYACDVLEGPLQAAKKNIQHQGYEDKIETILSDGLKEVPLDTNTIIIAGMGWLTAKQILETGLLKFKRIEQVVIQVNKDVDALREWISDHNYTIEREKMIEEVHVYQIISFTLDKHKPYSEKELFFGPQLLHEKNEVFRSYYHDKLQEYEHIVKHLAADDLRRIVLKKRIQWIREEI